MKAMYLFRDVIKESLTKWIGIKLQREITMKIYSVICRFSLWAAISSFVGSILVYRGLDIVPNPSRNVIFGGRSGGHLPMVLNSSSPMEIKGGWLLIIIGLSIDVIDNIYQAWKKAT